MSASFETTVWGLFRGLRPLELGGPVGETSSARIDTHSSARCIFLPHIGSKHSQGRGFELQLDSFELASITLATPVVR